MLQVSKCFLQIFFLRFLGFFISFDGVKHSRPWVKSISLIISASVFTCIFWNTRLECNLCMRLHKFAGSSQSHEYKSSQNPLHSTSGHWLRQLSSLHVSESFSMVYEINSPRNKHLTFQFKQKFKISISLRKICKNAGFP